MAYIHKLPLQTGPGDSSLQISASAQKKSLYWRQQVRSSKLFSYLSLRFDT